MQVAKYGARDRKQAVVAQAEVGGDACKNATLNNIQVDKLENLPYADFDVDGLYQQVGTTYESSCLASRFLSNRRFWATTANLS